MKMSTISDSRDVTKLKRQAEDKLQADMLRYTAINEGLEKSERVTQRMVLASNISVFYSVGFGFELFRRSPFQFGSGYPACSS